VSPAPAATRARAWAGLAAALALIAPGAAQAEPDLLAARRLACTNDTVTRCPAPDRCATRAANAVLRAEVLVIDAAAAAVTVRKRGRSSALGRLVEDRVQDGVRRMVMIERRKSGDGARVAMTLTHAGKLVVYIGDRGGRFDYTCMVES